MLRVSARFLAFLLALFCIGAIDVLNRGQGEEVGRLAPLGFVPSAAALPVVRSTLSKGAKPRVGVVVKSGKSIKVGNKNKKGKSKKGKSKTDSHPGPDKNSEQHEYKGKDRSAAGADEGSSFANTHGRVGMTLQLKRLEHPVGRNALMLYQHHINRANAKLAAMFRRAPVTREQMRQALERRKLSVLARRFASFEPSATLRSASSLLPSSLPRRSSYATAPSSAPPQASPGIGRRYVNPRLGYAKGPNTALAGQKRLLGGMLDGLFGKGDGQSASTEVNAVAPSTINIEDSLQNSAAKQGSNPETTKTGANTAAAADSGDDESLGFPEADLEASNATDLLEASTPTASQSLGLDIEANDIGYIITVEIGSEQLPFRMLVDSGSADTWVPSTSCSGCSEKHQRLGASTSQTFKEIDKPFSITYGTGDVQGKLAEDSLTIANMTLPKHTLGLAEEESEDFNADDVPFDGLLGLAKTELSNAGVATPIEALYSSELVSAPVMGYRLGRVSDGTNDGEVTFGGVDPFKFEGELTEIDNVSTSGFWEAAMDSISFGGKDLGLADRTAILDTGTTLIVAPEEDARRLHAAIEGSKPDGQGGYLIPCTTASRVAFAFGGKAFEIDPRDLVFLPVDEDDLQGDCVSAISAGEVGERNEWLVGATFLKNVYFATNAETNKIGLAPVGTS